MAEQTWSEAVTTEEFGAALSRYPGAGGAGHLHPTAPVAAGSTIPDEEEPLVALFKQVINEGLVSVHGPATPARVGIIGAGCAGLAVAYELKRAGFDVHLLEANHRVGGRVKTIRQPFSEGLHGEGGAMRLADTHVLVHTYLKHFGLEDQLERFEQSNRVIYLRSYGKTITYDEFDTLLKNQDPLLMAMFPSLTPNERGKTADQLWAEAVPPVDNAWHAAYNEAIASGKSTGDAITIAYLAVEAEFGGHTLRSYFEDVAGWSEGAIELYDLANAHVVLSNGFIESWKDSFLSSQKGGAAADMHQLMGGMDTIPHAFINPDIADTLKDDITYGARVTTVDHTGTGPGGVTITYETAAQRTRQLDCDYVVFAVPFPALNLIPVTPPFTQAKQTAIRTTRYVEVTKVLLQFRTRWWEEYLQHRNAGTDGGMVTDLPVRYLMFPPKGSEQFANGQNRGVVMASYVFEQDATELAALTEARRIELATDNLRTIFGDVIDENVEVGASQLWPQAELQGGSAFAYFGPGQKQRMFGTIIAPDWHHAAHFAGEHASYSHGWIEGAFESALRVAYQIYANQTLPHAGSNAT